MIYVTMKAKVRRTNHPVLVLGMDSRRAVTIDEEGNLRGYRLSELKASTLEAALRWDIDTKGVQGMLEYATSEAGEDGPIFEIGK